MTMLSWLHHLQHCFTLTLIPKFPVVTIYNWKSLPVEFEILLVYLEVSPNHISMVQTVSQ